MSIEAEFGADLRTPRDTLYNDVLLRKLYEVEGIADSTTNAAVSNLRRGDKTQFSLPRLCLPVLSP